MKKFVIASLFFAVSAQANFERVDKCFQVEKDQVARIVVEQNRVWIDWDLSDRAGYTEESGSPTDLRVSRGIVYFSAFLRGVGDGSDARFQITKENVKIQSLWSNGNPIGAYTSMKIVNCK